MGFEASMPVMYQPMDPVCIELPALLLELALNLGRVTSCLDWSVCNLSQSLQGNAWIVPRLGLGCFLPNYLQFTISSVILPSDAMQPQHWKHWLNNLQNKPIILSPFKLTKNQYKPGVTGLGYVGDRPSSSRVCHMGMDVMQNDGTLQDAFSWGQYEDLERLYNNAVLCWWLTTLGQ
jgi:hypothetical protein